MTTLNLGAGDQEYGEVHVDIYRSPRTTVLADIDRGLPFRDNSFDEVYSRCLFEHLKNPFLALLEMKRICKPGGHVVIITDNAGYPTHYIEAFYGDHVGTYARTARGPKDRHYAIYTREHLANLAGAAGLEVEKLKGIPGRGRVSFVTRLLRPLPFVQEMVYPWIHLTARKP